MEFDALSKQVIGCALEVHKQLGPGLLESTYEHCLAYELEKAGIAFERQKVLPVQYKDVFIDCAYRIDLLVNRELIVEIKSVNRITEISRAQLLTYLKLAKLKTGLLINFNEKLLRNGIRRMVL